MGSGSGWGRDRMVQVSRTRFRASPTTTQPQPTPTPHAPPRTTSILSNPDPPHPACYQVGIADAPEPSTLHRQARIFALSPARSAADIRAILSDHADPAYPIFRGMTLTTMVLDGLSGKLSVWCCGDSATGGKPPLYEWNVLHFFD